MVWQLGHLDDFFEPWSGADWPRVVERLKYLEGRGWRGIGTEARKSGTDSMIPPENLAKRARDRLVKLQLDDEDYLLSIRVHGGVRAWGVRIAETSICRLLWWDPKKVVYPTKMRHT